MKCDRCGTQMAPNEDGDPSCFMCGYIRYPAPTNELLQDLRVRRNVRPRRGKQRTVNGKRTRRWAGADDVPDLYEWAIPLIGKAIIPKRWLGRKSKFSDKPSITVKRLSEATGISRAQISKIFDAGDRPFQRTIDKLAAVGITYPRSGYTQRERVFESFYRACDVCGRTYEAWRRDSYFCSQVCRMVKWHKRRRDKHLCNWCGKPADGEYATTCRRHDAPLRKNMERSYQRRKRGKAPLRSSPTEAAR